MTGLTGPLGKPDKDNILPKKGGRGGRGGGGSLVTTTPYPPPVLHVGWSCAPYSDSELKNTNQFSFATSVQTFRDGLIARITKMLT